MACEQDAEDEALANVPEDFLDPIMGDLMRDPVILPSSGKILDRATIARHILRYIFLCYSFILCDIFTVHRNANIASAVLATAIPSVCLSVCLSVTCWYCVKTTARSTVQFALSDSKMCLVL